jgi:hypothetical protein
VQYQPTSNYVDYRIQIFEELKAEYQESIKGVSEAMQEDTAARFHREIAGGDWHHNTWRLGTQRDELGDKPDGCCEGGVKGPVWENRHRQGE